MTVFTAFSKQRKNSKVNTQATTENQEQAIYRVSGNLDQIQKHGLDANAKWEREYADKLPNRVMCSFTDKAEACDLYNQLWRRRLVAFRNWLD